MDKVEVFKTSGISFGYDSGVEYATKDENNLIYKGQKFINIDDTGIFVCDNYKYLNQTPTQTILVLKEVADKNMLEIRERAKDLHNAYALTIADAYPFNDKKFAYEIIFKFPEYKNLFWEKSEKGISENDLFLIACRTALKYDIPMVDIPTEFNKEEVLRINSLISPKEVKILDIATRFYELKLKSKIVGIDELKKLI